MIKTEVFSFIKFKKFKLCYKMLFVCGICLFGILTITNSQFIDKQSLFNSQTPIPLETEKFCRYAETIYPRSVWNYYTGYYCYSFTNTYRLNFKYNHTYIQTSDGEIPVGTIDNNTIFFFDYENYTSQEYIKKSFKTKNFYNLWIDCCEEAVKCCDNYMDNENILPSEEFCCPVVWDGWSCFPHSQNNTVSKLKCSNQAYSNTDANFCTLESEKYCTNGSWVTKTNYEVCAMAPVLRNRHNFHVIMLSIGSCFSFPAILIFLSFPQFRKTLRVIFHRNLIIIIIIRNMLTIMTKQIILLDELKSTSESNQVMSNNSVWCRILAFAESSAKNGMYAAMVADGFYLHKLIARPFANEPNVYVIYAIEALLTFIPSLAWATWKGAIGADQCWMVDTDNMQWISDGVRICILCINFLLLFDIIRCMIIKRKTGDITRQSIEAFRATLFLMPLFGIHILIITNRNMFGTDLRCSQEDIYYYVSYTIEGMQSVFVALTFCYFNTEVHKKLQNAYRKFILHLEQQYGWTYTRSKKNNQNLNRRRTTAQTFVESDQNVQKPTKKFNLHKKPYKNSDTETEI